MATWIEGKAFVPKINEEKLMCLAYKIMPVIRKDDKLYSIEIPDLRNVAYTWEPKIVKECYNLKEITKIKTHHYCGYYGFFKPSIAEVLAQIPEDLIDMVDAFEIINNVDSEEDEIKIFSEGNGQLATTVLYKKEAWKTSFKGLEERRK